MKARTRESIDFEALKKVQARFIGLINTYKASHKFLIFPKASIKIINDSIKNVENILEGNQNSNFEKYCQILQEINKLISYLNPKKDLRLINDLTILLQEELKSQEEADWKQKKCEKHLRMYDTQLKVKYSLEQLNKASLFQTKEEQLFYEKWKQDGCLDDYPLWKFLIKDIDFDPDHPTSNHRLNLNRAAALIQDVRGLAGLERKSQIVDTEDETFGLMVEDAFHNVGMLENILNRAKKELVEHFKQKGSITSVSLKNTIKKLSEPNGFSIQLVHKLLREKIHFCAVGNAISKLEEIRDILNGYSKEESLDNHDVDTIKKIIAYLSFLIRVDEQFQIIEKYKCDVQSANDNDALLKLNEIIKNIKTETDIFSNQILNDVMHLEKQISIMTLDNVLKVAVDYMEKYAHLTVEEIDSILLPELELKAEEVESKFLINFVKEVINPLRTIFSNTSKEGNLKISLPQYSIPDNLKSQGNKEHKTDVELLLLEPFRKKVKLLQAQKDEKKLYEMLSQYQSRFCFHHSSAVDETRSQASMLTKYSMFKADYFSWKFNNNNTINNISYPSLKYFQAVGEEYSMHKKQEKLDVFFSKKCPA